VEPRRLPLHRWRLAHAPALTALANPTTNSYRRLVPRLADGQISWAPTKISYGYNNRSCMLRLPAIVPRSRTVRSTVPPHYARSGHHRRRTCSPGGTMDASPRSSRRRARRPSPTCRRDSLPRSLRSPSNASSRTRSPRRSSILPSSGVRRDEYGGVLRTASRGHDRERCRLHDEPGTVSSPIVVGHYTATRRCPCHQQLRETA
jgi:hypothetical protein